MYPAALQARRDFLATSANGVGLLALASLLTDDGRLAAAPLAPHFAPKAKNCICIYLEGAPSQLDLFDPKPRLNQLHGQKLPESLTRNVRFAFLQKDTATVMGSPRRWTRHGQCGMELSELLPHLGSVADDICLIRSMHTEAFNHHPGQLLMNTGSTSFGRPSLGAWLTYGLGSESRNLPGYVVLNAGRGTSGGTSNWGSGFLPSTHAGTLFRNHGDPVLNLGNPPGVSDEIQQRTIEAVRDLNGTRAAAVGDPEVNARTAAYELAFRMQAAAPELIDLSKESQRTLDAYGLDRREPDVKADRGGGRGQYRQFAANCLLARRLVERGVRFVSLFHASWDHHSNLEVELPFNCGMADQPVAALIKDLKQRGLLDTTLVLWLSEFGRTPLGENRAGRPGVTGRDHHPFAFSVWAAGGGIKGGQVIGETDEIGWTVTKDPVHINDLHATLLHLFGLDHLRLTYRFQGRDFRLTDVGGKVVTKLLA
ncbi:DUF1501 domain-containing protein [Urbifossiella limnaea]|uniref:DUF1501 domain-containing protein n=1 Tax=Urbifossiella limnaea TaxID=2528023 RepID=A0A517Y2U8_9BACT|nr:DUF1501 domain-containing protein [Urbifossiella limnaea]QDU24075.1 hypothetical protein ETAA1_60880 [Urbifossiella limnaea]